MGIKEKYTEIIKANNEIYVEKTYLLNIAYAKKVKLTKETINNQLQKGKLIGFKSVQNRNYVLTDMKNISISRVNELIELSKVDDSICFRNFLTNDLRNLDEITSSVFFEGETKLPIKKEKTTNKEQVLENKEKVLEKSTKQEFDKINEEEDALLRLIPEFNEAGRIVSKRLEITHSKKVIYRVFYGDFGFKRVDYYDINTGEVKESIGLKEFYKEILMDKNKVFVSSFVPEINNFFKYETNKIVAGNILFLKEEENSFRIYAETEKGDLFYFLNTTDKKMFKVLKNTLGDKANIKFFIKNGVLENVSTQF